MPHHDKRNQHSTVSNPKYTLPPPPKKKKSWNNLLILWKGRVNPWWHFQRFFIQFILCLFPYLFIYLSIFCFYAKGHTLALQKLELTCKAYCLVPHQPYVDPSPPHPEHTFHIWGILWRNGVSAHLVGFELRPPSTTFILLLSSEQVTYTKHHSK